MPATTYCFHCSLPNPSGSHFQSIIDGASVNFCCPGCQAVAETIDQAGLGNYYQYRDTTPSPVDTQARKNNFALFDQADFQQGFVTVEGEFAEATLAISGIHCAACTWLIEHRLSNTSAIENVSVNLSNHKATVRWRINELALSQILQLIDSIGYKPAPWQEEQAVATLAKENKTSLARIGVAGIGMMQVGMYSIALHAGSLQYMTEPVRDLMRLAAMVISSIVVLYAAKPFFIGAWRGIKNRHPGMDLPVAIAIGGAFVASCWATVQGTGEVYFDSVVMFTFFLLVSRHMELRSRFKLNRTSATLASHTPEFAWQQQGDELIAVPPSTLQVGDIIIIKPGERIPADSEIINGHSSVDEAVISGEYMPITKAKGDYVTAGALNGDGNLTCSVTAVGKDSQLSIVNQLLEQAQQSSSPVALLADTIARYFVSAVLLIAAAVYAYWQWADPSQAFWITLSVLVISCPCALSLATPTAITAALGALRQRGILVRNSNTLQALPTITDCVFDKTGTITQGQLSINTVHCVDDNWDEAQCFLLAAALEQFSSHPIANAFTSNKPLPIVTDAEVNSGQGISGTINNQQFYIGSNSYIQSLGITYPDQVSKQLTVYLATNQQAIAVFELDDDIRPSAASAITALQQQHISTTMLSGDSSNAVATIANTLDINNWQNNLRPEHKLQQLQQMQQNGKQCIAVGDGINDLPLLGAANVSIAVASATDLTRTHADCIMLANDLTNIPLLVRKAKHTQTIIKQNLAWSLSYNICALPLAAMGLVPPYIAALGMSASSLVVIINAMRLWRKN